MSGLTRRKMYFPPFPAAICADTKLFNAVLPSVLVDSMPAAVLEVAKLSWIRETPLVVSAADPL